MGSFPSMKWPQFRRVLTRKPLEYRLDHQSGSHGKWVSDAGYPELRLAFHDQDELPGGLIKRILTKTVGLSEKQASSSSVVSCGVKMLELDAGVIGREPPVDPATGPVACRLPR
jgi:predicted RNA binding protein YcfA (HicA-like mRNA interferase family)